MTDTTTPQTKETIEALWRLQKIILNTLNFNEVVEKIVNGLLTELGYLDLGYRIIVLTLFDKDKNVLKRISLSQTDEARKALEASAVPFHEIEIPLSAKDNLLIRAFTEQKPFVTEYWPEIFTPVLTPDEAITNQKAAGIKTSLIYPVMVKGSPIGVLIFSMNKANSEASDEEKNLIGGFTDIVGLAVENSRLYSAVESTKVELEEANNRLQELDKKKDEFVSLASHELRTPMTAIKSYLWMALAGRGGPLTEKQHYYLDRSYSSTNRLIKLVNDLLNISRIESGRVVLDFVETKITDLINNSISEVKPRANELGIKLTVDCGPSGDTKVVCDVDKISEVLINIIGNAIKFAPDGGEVAVTSGVQGNTVVVHVKDNGEGLEPEDIGRLFQKFSLVKESYITNQRASQGTGLGLYISKSIVELHKGKIWVESAGRGKGSTFSFSLKISNPEILETMQKEYRGKEGLGILRTTI